MLVLLLSALAKWRLVGGQLACAVAFFFAVLLIVVVNVLWVISVLNYLSLGVTPMLIADWMGRYPLLVRRYLGWLGFSRLLELVSLVWLMLLIACLRIVISVVLVVAVRLWLPETLERLLLARNSVRLEFVAADLLSFIALACKLLGLAWSNVFLPTSSSRRCGTRAHKLLLKGRGLNLLMELLLPPVLLLLLIACNHWWRLLSPLLLSIFRSNGVSLMLSCSSVNYLPATCGRASSVLLVPGWLYGLFRWTGRYVLWRQRWIVATERWFMDFWQVHFRRDYILCGCGYNFLNAILRGKIAVRFLSHILLVHFPSSCLLAHRLRHFLLFFLFIATLAPTLRL